jgi:hypothetical protein
MQRCSPCFRAITAALVAAAFSSPCSARDYVLTVGGGYSPLGNQVSIERNVLFFRDLVAQRLPGAQHDILFSDGDSPGRDVQYRPAATAMTPTWELLGQVFQQEKNLGMRYRTHQIPGVRGAATRENLASWFADIARTAVSGDRVFVYATAHGGAAKDKSKPRDTALVLWNSQRLAASEFAKHLDQFRPGVQVVLVFAHCYAGGFADAVLDRNDAGPDALASRCGFFATSFDRPAAGCAPEIEGDSEHEYSSYFWAALLGRSRDGAKIAPVDYDGDGLTSLFEAHTFAVIHAESIDIPLTTSQAFLRRVAPSGAASLVGPFSIHMPIEKLRQAAEPVRRAAIDALSAQLHLLDVDRGSELLDLSARAAQARADADERLKLSAAPYQQTCQEVRVALVSRWPELANPWNAEVAELVRDEGDAIAKAIESHPAYGRLQSLRTERQRVSDERWEYDRLYAKCQRLLWLLDDVAIAGNLRLNGPQEQWRRYEHLVAMENTTLIASTRRIAPSEPALPDIR